MTEQDAALHDYVSAAAMPFDSFYRQHYRSAVRLAAALTGSSAAAEDVVQDVMAAAHKDWSRIGDYDDPVAWMRRAIANRAISRHRRAANAAKGLVRLRGGETGSVGLADTDWELWRTVAALPARQAQVIVLVYVERLTVELAAETLGIGVSSAKKHLVRARQRLATDLKDWKQS
jgi:RNA polymerase sigma-70 factor, ECF subfamily